jgi:hypothetical protein
MIRRWRWRAWTVLALLIAAALACSVEVTTSRFQTAGLYKDPDGQTKTRTFAPQDTVYCLVQLKNAKDDRATLRAVWLAAAQDQSPDSTIISDTEVQTGNGTVRFEAAPPEGGWLPGNYRVELYLNGDKRQTLDFKVK